MTITPEQIFLSSGHETPDPNVLFWVIEISHLDYQAIKQGLARKSPEGLEKLSKRYGRSKILYLDGFKDTFSSPDGWNDAENLRHKEYCRLQIQNQVEKYFSIINSYLDSTRSKIPVPKINYSEGHIWLFSDSKDQIDDWYRYSSLEKH